jgi:hypothetical protein
MPKLEITSNINPALFAYTENLKTDKVEKTVKVEIAQGESVIK